MTKNSVSINLLKQEKNDVVEKTISWALGIGRILIIVTELIALSAFLYRFTLDQQLVDLHSEIKNKQLIVTSFKEKEIEYRNLQERLSIIANYTDLTEKQKQNFQDILKLIPEDIAFTQISFNDNKVAMSIDVRSVSALGNFINSLKSYKNIESVSVDKIESKTTSAIITVGISLSLKPIPNNYAIQIK